uniref:Uncharacterized protein n=1 Tax=Arundo donax TaxID=35708 RepID=A0A0A8Y1E7_ARUDO
MHNAAQKSSSSSKTGVIVGVVVCTAVLGLVGVVGFCTEAEKEKTITGATRTV